MPEWTPEQPGADMSEPEHEAEVFEVGASEPEAGPEAGAEPEPEVQAEPAEPDVAY